MKDARWRSVGAASLVAAALAMAPAPAASQGARTTEITEAAPGVEGTAGFVSGARTFARGLGAGLELDGRHLFRSRLELGVVLEGAYLDRGYLSGQVVSPVVTGGAGLVLLAPVAASAPLELFVRYVGGVSYLEGAERNLKALRQTNELAVLGHLALGERGLLRAGVVVGVQLEVDPGTDLADQSQALSFGYGYEVSRRVLLFTDATAGGTFGFNGDNGKAILEASIGVRIGGARGAF